MVWKWVILFYPSWHEGKREKRPIAKEVAWGSRLAVLFLKNAQKVHEDILSRLEKSLLVPSLLVKSLSLGSKVTVPCEILFLECSVAERFLHGLLSVW